MPSTKLVICPYCGDTQPAADQCRACGGLFEPLSRQATHNAMGPWFVRDPERVFQPGCSYETLIQLVDRGTVTKHTTVRGPTTKQFWTIAKRVPGVAHLLGYCHQCDASVDPGDHGCHACGVPFGAYLDRNFMGLPDVRPLPWEADVGREIDTTSERASAELFMTAPLSGRISSFASDAELLGGQTPAAAARPGHSHGRGATGAVATLEARPAATGAEAAPSPDPAADAAARALRRRVTGQQKTIRILFGLLVGLLLVTAIGTFLVLRAGTNASVSPRPVVELPPVTTSDPVVESDPDPEAVAEEPDEAEEPVDTTADRTPPEDDAVPEYPDVAVDRTAVDELLADGADGSKPIAERIAAVESALELLERLVEDDASLRDLMDETRRELERLRLREFFP